MKKTPQLENGYIRIANDIAKQLAKTYMSSYESQILWCLFLKTYGFQKKEDWVSNSQFIGLTGMHKSHVSRTIKKLIQRNIVTQTGNKLAFQKDTTLWRKLPKQVTNKIVTQTGNLVTQTGNGVTHLGNSKLPKQADTKDTITKDTYTKDILLRKRDDKKDMSSAAETVKEIEKKTNYFIGLFKEVNPSYSRLFAIKAQRLAVDNLIKRYGADKLESMIVSLEKLCKLPYAPTITTPYELEMKMGRLLQFIEQEKSKGNRFSVTKV